MEEMKNLRICGASIRLTQEQDDYDTTSVDDQYLDIQVVDAGAGPYLVLKTDRWALDIDEIQLLIDKLNEVYKICSK